MRKMMTFAAVVCMAALTQAASIDWSVGNNAISARPSGASLAGIQVYLINAANQAGIVSAIEGGTFSGDTAGVLDMNTAANAKGAVPEKTATHDSLTAGTMYDYAFLVRDTAEGVDYYAISGSLSEMAYLSGEEQLGVAFTGADFAAGTGWVAVPEPTSMALLALGVAAIGLRRKFRA